MDSQALSVIGMCREQEAESNAAGRGVKGHISFRITLPWLSPSPGWKPSCLFFLISFSLPLFYALKCSMYSRVSRSATIIDARQRIRVRRRCLIAGKVDREILMGTACLWLLRIGISGIVLEFFRCSIKSC
jgi:hypothetical protein